MNFNTYEKIKLNQPLSFEEIFELFTWYSSETNTPPIPANYLHFIIQHSTLMSATIGIGIEDAINKIISFYEEKNEGIHFLFNKNNQLIKVWMPKN